MLETGYTQPINLYETISDIFGKTMTNYSRMVEGNSPVDSFGVPYELHHIGQQPDSPLAILTRSQHTQYGHDSILHFRLSSVVEHGYEWNRQKAKFWRDYIESNAMN